jgi:septal ring factor EnvC (AmiA/AmiB activator)
VALGAKERAAEAQIAALRSELAERDGALQLATQQITQRDAAIAMLQSELADARMALDQVNQRAGASEAEIDALRQDLIAVQREVEERGDELAAARQVGRSLLAALRTLSLPPPTSDRPVRKPQGIFRLIRG